MTVAAILRSKGTRVATTRPDASLAEAARQLRAERIGALVVSIDGRQVDGIVSERDIVGAVATDGAAALDRPLREVMTAAVRTCTPDDALQDLMTVMTEHRVRHLPVIEGGVLAGIISIGDVVKRRLDELQRERDAMLDYVSGR